MQYSPKLKKAMEEIKAILNKHDIAGVVVLHTPGFAEWFYKITPSYSAASVDNNHRFQLKVDSKKHYKGNKQKQQEQLTNTANMFNLLATNTGKVSMTLFEMSELVDKHLNAEHGDGGESFHDTQNN